VDVLGGTTHRRSTGRRNLQHALQQQGQGISSVIEKIRVFRNRHRNKSATDLHR
jgi:hypothetical protein